MYCHNSDGVHIEMWKNYQPWSRQESLTWVFIKNWSMNVFICSRRNRKCLSFSSLPGSYTYCKLLYVRGKNLVEQNNLVSLIYCSYLYNLNNRLSIIKFCLGLLSNFIFIKEDMFSGNCCLVRMFLVIYFKHAMRVMRECCDTIVLQSYFSDRKSSNQFYWPERMVYLQLGIKNTSA